MEAPITIHTFDGYIFAFVIAILGAIVIFVRQSIEISRQKAETELQKKRLEINFNSESQAQVAEQSRQFRINLEKQLVYAYEERQKLEDRLSEAERKISDLIELTATIPEKEIKLANLATEINTLQGEVYKLTGDLSAMSKELQDKNQQILDQSIEMLRQEKLIADLGKLIAEKEVRIYELEQQVRRLEYELSRTQPHQPPSEESQVHPDD